MALVVAPAPVWAQEDASIAGNVTDETGGALPGVTATASCDCLIEQTRVAVTDGAGNYRIIRLPPGQYTMTFSLQGFNTVIQENIVLTGSFAAPANAVLPIGELSESVTVSSQAPLVDIVSTRQQSTLTAERVNVLPGAAGINSAVAYVPGAVTKGGVGAGAQLSAVHGGDHADSQPAIDGVRTGGQLQGRNEWGAGVGGGTSGAPVTNEAIVTEVVFDTSSQSAEFPHSGVRTNVIPKSGGNDFSFDIFARGSNSNFASDNLSDELKAQGFQFAPVDYTWTINPAAGGPIVENKLWFFASIFETKDRLFVLDRFFDLDEPSTPDSVTADDLRAFNVRTGDQQSIRITHQLTQRNKLTYNAMKQNATADRVINPAFGEVSPEAGYDFNNDPTYITNVRWTAPLTNRLLFEADASYQRADVNTNPLDHGEFRTQVQDSATGADTFSSFQNHHNRDHHRRVNAAVSYVTGSHNFKAGLNYANLFTRLRYTPPGEIFSAYAFNGVSQGVLVTGNSDNAAIININCDCGLYVQDAWTMDRLTVNAGVRYDWMKGSVPGGVRPAGHFAPEVVLEGTVVEDVPDFKDVSGRFGVAYDLLGDGSTAVKASAGRYVANEGTGITSAFSPINSYALDWRSWNDLNGDGQPIDAVTGIPEFNEIGPSFNPNFGTGTVTTQYDPDTQRGTNWEYAVGIERQLSQGWALSGMWHYRRYGDFDITQNLNVGPEDWELAGTFTGPVDPELPGGASGREIPIYNIADPTFAIVTGNDRWEQAPDDWRSWKGFELILDGELPRGGFMTVSLTAGKFRDHFCTRGLDNPNLLLNCETTSPYQPMGKVSGALPLPFDSMISGLWQVLPGNVIDATYGINEVDFPGLFQGIGTDSPTLDVNLIEPGTEFEPYRSVLQLRVSKVITVGEVRTRVYMDAENLFNQTRVTRRNQSYGGGGVKNPSFVRILGVEQGRVLTFGLQSSF